MSNDIDIEARIHTGPVSVATWMPTHTYDLKIDGYWRTGLKPDQVADLLEDRDRDEVVGVDMGYTDCMEIPVFLDFVEGMDE